MKLISTTGLLTCLALTSASAQTVQLMYSFTGQQGGANPLYGALVQGTNGGLYGTAYDFSGQGSIFKYTIAKGIVAMPVFNGANGQQPSGGLVLGTDGEFYGVTSSGGSANMGVLFRINPAGSYTLLHEFLGVNDGVSPVAPPIEAADGNFYGTTAGSVYGTAPTVYKYEPATGAFTTLITFAPSVAQSIYSPLIQASNGYLLGTASAGGASNNGSIFGLTTTGQLVFLYSFPGTPGGASPAAPLIEGVDGNFYGTTQLGGGLINPGTIFKLERNGVVSILHRFGSGPNDANHPLAALVQGTDGNLYGSTPAGGRYSSGVIFQISTSGAYKEIFTFDGPNGQNPFAPPTQDTNGVFYGTTELGGTYGYGVLYSLDLGLAPFVRFVRSIGKTGSTVQILGQGLTGTSEVTFNGVRATRVQVLSDTYLKAVVPSGATSGPVVVTTPKAVLTSNRHFTVVP